MLLTKRNESIVLFIAARWIMTLLLSWYLFLISWNGTLLNSSSFLSYDNLILLPASLSLILSINIPSCHINNLMSSLSDKWAKAILLIYQTLFKLPSQYGRKCFYDAWVCITCSQRLLRTNDGGWVNDNKMFIFFLLFVHHFCR